MSTKMYQIYENNTKTDKWFLKQGQRGKVPQ